MTLSHTTHTFYLGHVLDVLRTLPDESVHCVVTSPPYWGLRAYGTDPQVWGGDPACEHDWGGTPARARHDKVWASNTPEENRPEENTVAVSQGRFCSKCSAWLGELGLEPTPELYVQHLVEVFREVKRVLRKDGTCWINLGDSYAGSRGGPNGDDTTGRHEEFVRSKRGGNRWGYGDHFVTGLKPKDLVGIPWRTVFALQADGWWLRAAIIWNKPNPMPESTEDRPTRSHEDVFLLTKSGSTLFWTHPKKRGTRKAPKPDYIWLHSPSDKTEHPCATDYQPVSDRFLKAVAAARARAARHKKPYRGPSWTRRNLWQGHDYFYDGTAIQEPSITGDMRRPCGSEGAWALDGRPEEQKHGGELRKQDALGKNTYTGFNDRYEPLAKRSKRDVWSIATQPFPGAHFAVFPEALVEPCIKAGTSEKGCCPKCGAPWVRITSKHKVGPLWNQRGPRTGQHPEGDLEEGRGKFATRYEVDTDTLGWRPTCSCSVTVSENRKDLHGPTYSRHRTSIPGGQSLVGFIKSTIGWHPTCSCNLPPVPAVVLDLFGGSGTVNVVARDWSRSSIYIDLKPEYRQMAMDRMGPQQQSLVQPFEIVLREVAR